MTTDSFDHWEDCPSGLFSQNGIINFSPEELSCKGTGKLIVHWPSLRKLQDLRNNMGKPMIVNSAYRTPEYNKSIGGKPESMHLQGKAFDISLRNHDPAKMWDYAERAGFRGFAFYNAENFIHIDTGPIRTWGDVVERQPTYTAEKPKRKSPVQSKTVKAGVTSLLAPAAMVFDHFVGLPQTTQWILLGVAGIAGIAAMVVLRERLRKWAEGDR